VKKYILFVFLSAVLFSCIPAKKTSTLQKTPVKTEEKNYRHIYCIKEIKMQRPMETALDVLTRYITKAVLTSGNILQCSSKTDRYISLDIKSLYIYSIGYSISQRASIYKVNINMDVIIENRKNQPILKENVKETTQYVGAGLRADIERRYALEELAKLIEVRIFTILSKDK